MEPPPPFSCASCGAEWTAVDPEVCPRCGRSVAAAPPPVEGLPEEPTGGFGAPVSPVPPALGSRWVTLLAVLAMAAAYFALGGTFAAGLTAEALEAAGGLHGKVLEQLPTDGWRLVLASFLHADLFVLIVTLLLVWAAGGEAERRGGSGLIWTGLVVLGPLLNAVRVTVEPGVTLGIFAGGWPVGVALGGAAAVLAGRRGDGAARIGGVLLLETAILLFLAFAQNALAPVATVVGAAAVAGAALGSIWPLGEAREGVGCCAFVLALLVLGSAELARETLVGPALPPPWTAPDPAEDEATFELRRYPAVGIALEVPDHWSEPDAPESRTCPECDAPVPPPEAPGAATTCPACGAAVLAPKRTRVQLSEGSGFLRQGMERQVLVIVAPKGPFDAPDTLATRFAMDLGQPGSFVQDAQVVDEGELVGDALGLGYSVTVSGRLRGRTPVYVRIVLFVHGDRTLLVRLVGPVGEGGVLSEWDRALTDRIARSVQLLDEEGR